RSSIVRMRSAAQLTPPAFRGCSPQYWARSWNATVSDEALKLRRPSSPVNADQRECQLQVNRRPEMGCSPSGSTIQLVLRLFFAQTIIINVIAEFLAYYAIL